MGLRNGELVVNQFKKSGDWIELDDKNLRQLKDALLIIADDFVSYCERHGLSYYMAYGTALGAVRHGGFIPWDDDMDFYLPRKDYEFFIRNAEKELGDKYVLRSIAKGDKVGFTTCHFIRKGTRYTNYGDLVLKAGEPIEAKGLYIDVFPLDDSSDIKLVRDAKGVICLCVLFAMSCITTRESVDWLLENGVEVDSDVVKAVSLKYGLGGVLRKIRPLHKWCALYNEIARDDKHPNSKYFTVYTACKDLRKDTIRRDYLEPAGKGVFEGRIWRIPGNAADYLSHRYGAFMEFPPVNERRTHPVFEVLLGDELIREITVGGGRLSARQRGACQRSRKSRIAALAAYNRRYSEAIAA